MAANSNSGNDPVSEKDVWADAPDTPLQTYITTDQRAELVNSKATLFLVGMDYNPTGRFGPNFDAEFFAPDGSVYRYSMTTNGGRTPRDKTNKWLWELINKKGATRVPVQLIKQGNAYFLAKPGSDTELVRTSEYVSGSPDEIPF